MKEDQILANGKLETPQIAKEQQIIYLDFDGADTIYQNSALDLNISVNVKDSGLSQERIDEITNELNRFRQTKNILRFILVRQNLSNPTVNFTDWQKRSIPIIKSKMTTRLFCWIRITAIFLSFL